MNNIKFSKIGLLVWIICAVFFLYEFLLRTILGTYQQEIVNELQLSKTEFSLLSSTLFLLIYVFMQIPVSILVDNIGLKKTLTFASFICSISAICFAYIEDYYFALFLRSLMGLGASFGFICLLISVNEWIPRKYNALFIGLSQFIGTMGPMIAAGPLDSLSANPSISWRVVFKFIGLIGIIITIAIFIFVKNNNQRTNRYIILRKPENTKTLLKKLFFKLQPWVISICSACLYFSLEYLSENDGRIFLCFKNITSNQASYMITIGWLGYALGAPVIGYLSDFLQRRKIILILSSALNLIGISIVVYSHNKLLLFWGFFLLGIGTSSITIGYAMMNEQFKKNFSSIGIALNNTLIVAISAINAPLLSKLIDNFQVLNYQCYVYVFNFLIVIAVIALFLSIFFIKETYCKSAVDFTYLTKDK